MRQLTLLFVLIVMSFSCGHRGIEWDPVFYSPDVDEQHLINRHAETVSFQSEDMHNFACLTIDKVKELKEILIRARIPKDKQAIVFKALAQTQIR